MFVSAIIVAAGKSKRFKSGSSKVILNLNSKPVIAYSLDILNAHPRIKEIIVVSNPENIKKLRRIIKMRKICKTVKFVLGGKERKDSAAAGLKSINPKAEFVLIHDAARPFITSGLVSLLIKEAQKSKAVIVGVPVKATVKRIAGKGKREEGYGKQEASKFVKETIDRRNLWEVQTPQVFEKDLILEAYRKFGGENVTDDASLVEKLGKPVKIILGSALNIKITTPEDMAIGKAIVNIGLRK